MQGMGVKVPETLSQQRDRAGDIYHRSLANRHRDNRFPVSQKPAARKICNLARSLDHRLFAGWAVARRIAENQTNIRAAAKSLPSSRSLRNRMTATSTYCR